MKLLRTAGLSSPNVVRHETSKVLWIMDNHKPLQNEPLFGEGCFWTKGTFKPYSSSRAQVHAWSRTAAP